MTQGGCQCDTGAGVSGTPAGCQCDPQTSKVIKKKTKQANQPTNPVPPSAGLVGGLSVAANTKTKNTAPDQQTQIPDIDSVYPASPNNTAIQLSLSSVTQSSTPPDSARPPSGVFTDDETGTATGEGPVGELVAYLQKLMGTGGLSATKLDKWNRTAQKILADRPRVSVQTHKDILDYAFSTKYWNGKFNIPDMHNAMAFYAKSFDTLSDQYDQPRKTKSGVTPGAKKTKNSQAGEDKFNEFLDVELADFPPCPRCGDLNGGIKPKCADCRSLRESAYSQAEAKWSANFA